MDKTELSEGALRKLRIIAATAGVVLILVGLLADALGLSVGEGLSRNQLLMAVLGLVLVVASMLGRKLSRAYRTFAIILLNVIILAVILDLAALVVVKLIEPGRFEQRKKLMDVGNIHIQERIQVHGRYVPYVLFRAYPDSVIGYRYPATTDSCGFRVTTGTPPPEVKAVDVFMFGGSAMWGARVPDSCTIASYLQRTLPPEIGVPFRVRNFGQPAYVSTQEVIELMLQLQSGNVPDLVVFYNGFNDVAAAYESGVAGAHYSLYPVMGRVEGWPEALGEMPLAARIFSRTNTYLLLTSLRLMKPFGSTEPVETYLAPGTDMDSLAGEIVSVYLGNADVVEHLGDAYGFETFFVWQPAIWCGEKELTSEEEFIASGMGETAFAKGTIESFAELTRASYAMYGDTAAERDNYRTFEGIFDDEERQIYSDVSGAHCVPYGTRMVADSLFDLIRPVCDSLAGEYGNGIDTTSATSPPH